MKKLVLYVLVFTLLMLVTSIAFADPPLGHGPWVHKVQVGGPDACVGIGLPPGCDKNLSLGAKEFADGSASGQLIDRFGYAGGGGGFFAVIDCVSVVGNDAWVSGVVIRGTGEGNDLAGVLVALRVRDNGTSANDLPDRVSFPWIPDHAFSCTDQLDVELFDAPQGQVKVQ